MKFQAVFRVCLVAVIVQNQTEETIFSFILPVHPRKTFLYSFSVFGQIKNEYYNHLSNQVIRLNLK